MTSPETTDPYDPPTADNFEGAKPWLDRATEVSRQFVEGAPLIDSIAIALGQAYAAGRRQGRHETTQQVQAIIEDYDYAAGAIYDIRMALDQP